MPMVRSFIQRIQALPKGPGVLLHDALQPSLQDEAELRRLFATDKTHARLADPYVGLIDVFAAPADIRTTRARVVTDETDLSAHYVMPLSDVNRRKEGSPSMVSGIDEFKKNWGVFTEGSLSQLLDWNNVVAAGGAVLACLTPLSEAAKASKRSMRKYYHTTAYPTSDVDLFLWGLTPEQAEAKIIKIYEAVRDSVPWDVTCVRTKHTVSIHSQYPYRPVQIVLRLYRSPAEILAGFDIDAPCCAYDGNRVYANPRAIVAMMQQCNTVDMTRRSPSYEVRLAKYSSRAFEVYVPSLSRKDIDPTIFERSIVRVTGLARLLVLEKLTTTDERFTFLETRRTLRGRPNPLNRYRRMKRKFKGDLKAPGTGLTELEINDYDVASLHIPYGPGWDARRIDKLVYQTDLGMNSTYNPKNEGRRLHRHPAFFGTIEECMEDCCEHCPAPIDEDERKLQAEEDEGYVRGRILFIQDDPGRQSLSGSFNPIDFGEWSEQVYIGPTARFFSAIAAHNRAEVTRMLAEGQEVDRRDHVGRTPLHVAIICGATDIACDLIDAGARMTSRLVDGRTSLHLAAQYDLPAVVRKLLERSAANAEKVAKGADSDGDEAIAGGVPADPDRPSSEDDWSSEEDDMALSDGEDVDGGAKKAKIADGQKESGQSANSGDLPEDETNEPDIIDVNLSDWDLSFTALSHAIVSGSLPIVEALLSTGADAKLVSQAKGSLNPVLPLVTTIIGDDDERTCKIAERLIMAGASTSAAAENSSLTVFHRAVAANKPNLVATFLRYDRNAKTALDYPVVNWNGGITPLVTAVNAGNYSVIAALLAFGASLNPSMEVLQRAFEASQHFSHVGDKLYRTPLETALAQHDHLVRLLVDLGVEISSGVRRALVKSSRPEDRRTYLDWVQWALPEVDRQIAKLDETINPPESFAVVEASSAWKRYLANYEVEVKSKAAKRVVGSPPQWHVTRRRNFVNVKAYFIEMEKMLLDAGAKSWGAVYPHNVSTAFDPPLTGGQTALEASQKVQYCRMTGQYYQTAIPEYLNARYDELFEACFIGNNTKVEELCLPTDNYNQDFEPLQISASVADGNHSSGTGLYHYSRTGITPLTAAIFGRRWSTARLVMAIAAAQYKPAPNTAKFNTSEINLEDDSDNESEDSNDSDDTVEEAAINFIDIARRPSAVACDVHPKDILQRGTLFSDPFLRAIQDDDFETFVNLFPIYEHSPIPVDLPNDILSHLVSNERVDMLDEFIRRTGSGIRVTASDLHAEEVQVVNDKNKVYLGLTVHGKKRTDLAKQNDPNASQSDVPVEVPLVWQAVLQSAMPVLDYLSSDRVLAAYKFYSSNHSSDTARLLKRTPDLAKVLPEWLGWTFTPLGESPLTVAFASKKKMETVNYLFQKAPRLMASALHERVKFLGMNSLMIAVQTNCEVAVLDFLLGKSVSPAERDQINGWNIFHYACNNNHHELLKYFLKKLPRDVVEALLAQQSKGRLNTPLHLAVKKGFKLCTQHILAFSKSTALVRDVDGSIPLHSASRLAFADTIQLLVDAAPAGIHMENGVGDAPLEIAALAHLLAENGQTSIHQYSQIGELNGVSDTPDPLDVDKLERELPKLRTTLDTLVEQGTLGRSTNVGGSLYAFVAYMEEKLLAAKAVAAARKAEEEKEKDAKTTDVLSKEVMSHSKSLANVKMALRASAGGHRELVHLVDAQTSVQSALSNLHPEPEEEETYGGRYGGTRTRRVKSYGDSRENEGLEAEADSERKKLSGIWIRQHVQSSRDRL